MVVLEEQLDWIQRVQEQVDVQQATEQIKAFVSVVGGLVFEVALQLTAQAIVTAL